MTEADAQPEAGTLAVFEATWLIKLRALAEETSSGVRLVAVLCGDKATQRAIRDGDSAARHETLWAFGQLSTLHARFRELLVPAPRRWATSAAMTSRAFTLLAAAAETFAEASDQIIDFEALASVGERIAAAGELIGQAARLATEQSSAEPAPAATHRPLKRGATATDD